MLRSLPLWGAWIETLSGSPSEIRTILSLPLWGAWIETMYLEQWQVVDESLPLWGAWIETPGSITLTRWC